MSESSQSHVQDLDGPDEIFRILCRNLPGVVYLCANDEKYTVIFLSEAIKEMVGFPAEDFRSGRRSFINLIHPEDRARIPEQVNKAVQHSEPYHLVYRIRHADGRWLWIEGWGQGVFGADGELRFLEGSIFDITRYKRAEEESRRTRDDMELRVEQRTAQLAKVNQQLLQDQQTLKTVLEKYERQHRLLAYEIHDGMVQYATGALLQLETAKRHQLSMHPKAEEACEKVYRLLKETIQEGRRVISGLRPPVLDEMGIVAAIEYLVHEEGWPENVQVDLDLPPEPIHISDELETVLFRIAQEAINNVRRHSQTERVLISLECDAKDVRLEVRDWGVGFDPDAEQHGSFGLRGIRERAKVYNGNLKIDAAPAKGVRLVVDVPVSVLSFDI